MHYVPSRPKNSNNVEDVEISTRGATKNKGESDGSPGTDSFTFNNVKQGKLACNGDDYVSPKEYIQARDKASTVGVVNDIVLPRSSTELSGDTSRTPPVANGNFTKFDKEEGELSPNVYFDEADLAAYGDHNRSNAKAKHNMEIDADADDEDNKNVLKGSDDLSGSESTDDECSREDHEDRDHDNLDGKAKSKGEAEGIEDANFIGADGTYSDHIWLSAKLLAKHVASPLHDGGKKDCNVFYGNESFYALF
nr:paired amphipathic helix protein Sin3-like 2 isoform X1 [Tanacetum cinerariifolium]